MPAITIRNLPESVHATLKQRAAAEKLSVEALVRRVLATEADTRADTYSKESTPMTGFSEASAGWIKPPAKSPLPDLWGALHGAVHVPPDTDLTAPLGEPWKADL